MSKLRKKKCLALLGILLLVFTISGIFLLSRYDKFRGLITVKTADIKLLSDVSLASTNIKGTDELVYEVKYTLDEIDGVSNRDVVIKAELSSKYARFKAITNPNTTYEISNDGRSITINISNVPLGEEQTVNFKINVLNAPNGEEIKPIVDIKEVTGEYTRLDTDSVFVETNSIEGIVYDENELPVKNIELSINKDDQEIKRTYTTNEGTFVFTDLEEGNYKINVEEDNYDIVGNSASTENNERLILHVKEVDKFYIETHKYIEKLKLIIDGKEKNYSYEDAEKVIENIKKFKNISGEIEYKIVVKNNGDKRTVIKNITDEIEDGLSFDENKNPGWSKVDDKVKYLPIEDVILDPYEKRIINITLDIVNTKELKTYTNKVTTKGDIKERVVFIVNDEEIRNITVNEGDKITKPTLDKDVIWYTDRNETNPYNFDNPVTKDLILYATLVEKEYKVTYMDGENKFYEETVNHNEKANGPSDDPVKSHNIFLGWYLNDSLFDFDTLITEDITLESKYEEVEAPTIDYSPVEWTNDRVSITISSIHDDYTYMYKIGDGDYAEYFMPFNLSENDTVYAYSIKNNVVSTEETVVINNIDKINPLINQMEFDSITPVSAKLDLKIKDEQSGLDKYRVYVDDVLIFESPSYTTDVNEEKIEQYLISNLEELTTYSVKLEVLDVAGNSFTKELTLETPPKHYVARILNYEMQEIERYESLEEAIESDNCLVSCHVEMLDDVTESNDVLAGQDITLDLNGKTITGLTSYAIKNNGNLKVVDYNDETIGKIKSDDIPVINKGIFQFGENEEELDVSTERPIIEGNANGVQNTGTFKFYDGSIAGVLPVDGMINDTPFLYNANVNEVGSKQIATLTKVADAVARLNAVYYTDAQLAIDKSANGHEEEVDFTKSLIKQLKSSDSYRFVYDEETDSAGNTNKGFNSTLAHSYIKLDLTNYTDNQLLHVNTEIAAGNGDYGYATVTESINAPAHDDTNGRFIYLTGTVAAKDYSIILKKGKVYYLHFGFRKDDSSNYDNKLDTFKINRISLSNFDQVEFSSLDNIIMYNDPSYYGFEKQVDGSYVSTNEGRPNSYSHSYFAIDLTNINESRYLYLNAKISSQSNNDFGYVTVNNSFNIPTRDANGRQFLISGEQAEAQYDIELQPNQINFVHIVYNKANNYTHSGEDKFTITSIKPLRSDTDEVTDGVLVNNGDYYFEKLKVVPDLTSNNYAIINGVTKTESNGFDFNGNNSGLRMEQVIATGPLSEESLILNINPRNTSNQLIYMGSNNEKVAFGVYNNYLIVSVGSSNKTNTYPIPAGFTDGTDKKIVITCNSNKEYSLYYNNVLQENQSTLDAWQQGVNTYTYIGTRDGNYPYPYNGVISSVKTYNRVLSEEEILGTPSDEGLILYIDGSADLVERDAYVNNNPGIYPTTASSYMLFDLTNKTSDMTLRANVTINSRSSNYGYITVKETPTVPAYNDSVGRYYYASNTISTSNVNIKLEAGKLNYVHFCFYDSKPKSTSYNEQLRINSLRLLRDDLSSDMYDIDYITHTSVNYSGSEIIPVLNKKAETVELLKNITLSKPLEIVNTRDVVLDLNGKTLTTSVDNYVIKNEGSLKIIDSDYDERLDINERYKEEQAALFRDAIERYTSDKEKYEEYAGLCDGCEPSEEYKLDQSLMKEIDYTGTEEEYVITASGDYKLEVWGAQGGTTTSNQSTIASGGYGGYSKGEIALSEGDKLYINVGGQGENVSSGRVYTSNGGYNGGGNGYTSRTSNGTAGASGGGATSIATKTGLLYELNDDINSIIMVAGGGGGSHSDTDGNGYDSAGGHGGGYIGHYAIQIDGSCSNSCTKYNYPSGGTQENGGLGVTDWMNGSTSSTSYVGQFGLGAIGSSNGAYGGGGGGFYGGASGYYNGGAGGSGYIANNLLTNKKMVMYSTDDSLISNEESTKTNITTNHSATPKSNYAKEGNGYVRITRLLTEEEIEEMRSHLPKTYNVKEQPLFKDYIKTIDFDDSIDIDSLDIDSNPTYKKKVSEELFGTISSTTNSVILNDYDAKLNIEAGIVTLDKTGTYNGITNKGELTLGKSALIKTLQSNNRGIANYRSGDILTGSGTINTIGSSSIGIYNDSYVEKEIKGYTIKSSVDSSYNIYNQNYKDLKLEDISTSGKGIDIYQNTDSNLLVKSSTLGSTGNESFYSNTSNITSTITFDDCNILNRINNRNDSKRIINIVASDMISGSRGNNIYNGSGTVTLSNSEILKTSNSGTSYEYDRVYYIPSIYNSGSLSINNTKINKNPTSTSSNYAYPCIYNAPNGNTSINGETEISNQFEYGIYNRSNVTLGDNSNSVSTADPTVQGYKTAIYNDNNSRFDYYDGKLIGPINNALLGGINDLPENYDLYSTDSNETQTISLKSYDQMILDNEYVAAIGNNKYIKLQDAIDAANNSNTEIILLRDIITGRTNTILEDKNITINQNNHSIKSFNNITMFTNNGIFAINNGENSFDMNNISANKFIINNGRVNYKNIKTKSQVDFGLIINNENAEFTMDSGELITTKKQVLNNSGQLTINGGKIYYTLSSVTYDSNNLINNNGNIIINNSNMKFGGSGSVIYNNGTVTVNNITAELCGSSSGTTSFINNQSTAHTYLNGGIYGISSCKKGIIVTNNGLLDITGTISNQLDNNSVYSKGGTINIENATITQDNSNSLLYLEGTSNLNVTNSSITNTNHNAIHLNGKGTTNIVSGTIKSTNSVAIYVPGSGILNIGTKNASADKNIVKIEGLVKGLSCYNENFAVNFYDGTISGNIAIDGIINDIEDGYDIILEQDGDTQHKYLGLEPVVRNKRTGVSYNTIQEAINAASDNDTLELLREYSTTVTASTITNNKVLTFDLMGNSIYQNNPKLFINTGTLTMKTSVDGGSIRASVGVTFDNSGTLNIDNGIYYHRSDTDIIVNAENAILNISGGEIYSTNSRIIDNSGRISITGGKLYTTDTAGGWNGKFHLIANSSTGEIIINGGEIKFSGSGAVIFNYGRVEVYDTTVNLSGFSVWTSNAVALTSFIKNITSDSYAKITGGTYGVTNITGRLVDNVGTAELIGVSSNLYGIAENSGSLTIKGSTYNLTSREYFGNVLASSAGTVTIEDCTLTDTGGSSPTVYLSGTSNLVVRNTNITSKNHNAIHINGTGITNLISGTIKATNSNAINMPGAGTINIGVHDGTVNRNSPVIEGVNYGLINGNSNGMVNFYDGEIIGKTATQGVVIADEEGYEIISTKQDNIEHKYLGILPLIKNKTTGIEYNSIQEAINAASNDDTLELIREYTTNSSLPTIVNSKNITIDLKGYNINQNVGLLFTNSGTLNIKSSTTGSVVNINLGSFITNNGILNMDNVVYNQKTTNDVIVNNENATLNINGGQIYSVNTRIINNYGQLNVYGGKLNTTSSPEGWSVETALIDNNSTGIIIFNGGEIKHGGTGAVINNYGRVEVNDAIVNLTGWSLWTSNTIAQTNFIKNITSGSYAKIVGGSFGPTSKNGRLINNAGTAELLNSSSNLYGIAVNTGTLLIKNGNYNVTSMEFYGDILTSSSGTLTIEDSTINETGNIHPLVNISGNSNLIVNNSTLSAASHNAIKLMGTGTANITSGTVTSSSTYAIYIEGASTLNVGTLGGIPSTDNPVIYGKTYGIYKNNNSANIYFYDGVIKGETGPISGSITDYEPGYKEERNTVTDPDTGVTTINSTLTIIGDDIRKVVVNNINFTSLQSAVNYAVSNSIARIDLYNDVEIESDIIKPEGINVNVYLNGYHIIGDYNIDSGINIIDSNNESNNLGASILRNNTNHENIVIYQLDNGSDLKTNVIYKLYKLKDGNYENINVNENKIGSYDIGNETEELYTVNSRIYINNISEGTYKLSGSDGNEINFEILSDGVSSNIRINNMFIKNRVVEAIAVLILQLQTGIYRTPYILIILVTIIIILSIIAIKKHKRI